MDPRTILSMLEKANHKDAISFAQGVLEKSIPSSDYGEDLPYCTEAISFGIVTYSVEEGKVTGLSYPGRVYKLFGEEGISHTFDIELLFCSYPEDFRYLSDLATAISEWDSTPKGDADFSIMKDECRGCQKDGPVNYKFSRKRWGFYCGGSPRCCP